MSTEAGGGPTSIAGSVRIRPAGPVDGRIAAPASKSVTIRRVLVAALAPGTSRIGAPLVAEDTQAVRRAVTALGVDVVDDGGDWLVSGSGTPLAAPVTPIDCDLSGTTLRLATALACHASGPVTLTGSAPLRRRPIGALVDALVTLGGRVEATAGGLPPVRVGGGGLDGGAVTVDVTRSSQYASAILLTAPAARQRVDLALAGVAASAYVRLTVDALVAAGAAITPLRRGWRVEPGPLRPVDGPVEHDASAACHLLALAVTTGGTVTVVNAGATRQPDAAFVDVLAAAGAAVARDGDAVTVRGPSRPRPIDVDLSETPDQLPVAAVLAALADGTSRLSGAAVTRGHETDRIAALAGALGQLGVEVEETADGLVVHGASAGRRELGEVRLPTSDDHRLAMAYAALGAAPRERLRADVVVTDADCVAKTYPGFWTDVASLGVDWERVP